MMDYLDQQQIRSLLENCAPPAISIYMPTHRGGSQSKQDPIRLKNALVEARQKLTARRFPQRQAEALLAACRALLDDGSFWRALADGLVVFADLKGTQVYRLPFVFEDLVVVADAFFVKPLLPFLNRNGEFYLLALSEQRVRLFRASPYGIKELELLGVPASMKEAFEYDQQEQQQQWHTRAASVGTPNSGLRQAIFHGQGGAADEAKQDRERFIRIVDRALTRRLADKSLPLVLASVEHSAATYRAVSTYPRLLDSHVQGNPDHLESQDLWRRAWPCVEPELLRGRGEALKRCQEQAHSDLGGNSFEKVTPRAYGGRVDELIVAVDRTQYGTFDPRTLTVSLQDQPTRDNLELLEFTASQTLLHDGSVYAMNSREIPGGSWLLASFRY